MTWFYILPLSSGVPVIFKQEELLNQIPTSLQSDPREGLYKPEMALELLQSAVRRTATAKSSKNLRKKAQAGAAKSASRVERWTKSGTPDGQTAQSVDGKVTTKCP